MHEPASATSDAGPVQTPFCGATTVVRPEWIDRNGHMNVGYYHVAFDRAAVPLFDWLGLTQAFRDAHRCSLFALETHLSFQRECREGESLRFHARLLAFDRKRIHFFQEMLRASDGARAATYECLSSYVDMTTRRTAPMPAVLQARLAQVLEAHRVLPRPWQVGHRIGTPPGRDDARPEAAPEVGSAAGNPPA
ncbi:MAG: thioesterase family protein [Lautropia sp.]